MSADHRSRPWAWIGLAAGCGLLLMCACLAAVGSGALLVWRDGLPVGGLRPAAVNRIAYQGNDGNIRIVAPDGSDDRPVTTDGDGSEQSERFYMLPTWSPDSRQIAYVRVAQGASDPEATLQATNLATGTVESLHSATGVSPFYLFWSPDSRSIAFLEATDETIALRLSTLGATQSQELGQGSPYYFDWSPDSRELAYHIGGVRRSSPTARVGRRALDASGERSVSEDPALFLSPDWSPDGRTLLFARRAAEGGEVMAADTGSSGAARTLLPFTGAVSFAWAPRGDRIGYIVTERPEVAGLGQIAFGRLMLTDASGANLGTLADGEVLAFFWSPDGGQIAYLTLNRNIQGAAPGPQTVVAQDDEVWLRWNVADVTTGQSRALTTFVPSAAFADLIPFFDQYARSLQVWSPDSRSLVYGVDEGGQRDGVYVVDIAPGASPRRVAVGSLGVWSGR